VDNNLDAALAADPGTFYQQVRTVSDNLLALMETRNKIEDLADTLEEQRLVLVEGQDTGDIPFLSTLRILSKGRETEGEFDGIAGAMDAFWDHGVSAMETASTNSLQENMDAGIEAAAGEQWEDALAYFDKSYIYSLAAVHSGTLRLTREQTAGGEIGEEGSLSAQAAAAPPILDAQVSGKIVKGYEKLIPYYQGVDDLLQEVREVEDLDQLQETRTAVVSRFDDIRVLIAEWDEVSDYYQTLAEEGLVLSDTRNDIENFKGVLDGYETDMMTREGMLVHRINEVYFSPLYLRFGEQADVLEEGRVLVAGEFQEEREDSVVKKYPREAIELLQPVDQLLSEIDEAVSERLAELENENEYIIENEAVAGDIQAAQEFTTRLRSFQGELGGLLSEAEREVELAELFKRDGAEKIDDTERLLRENEFKEALDALDEAGVAFAESLKHQEDELFREEIDRQKQALVETITQEWQNQVVRQVRSYINEANTYYRREDFAKAQVVLLKAEDVWSDANAELNEEIESWLIRVENALKATTGRIIQETNPLYAEMSNLLNLAQDDFQQGKRYLNDGARETAEDYFRNAEEKISYVKDPFPINQAAGVLLLRIEQLRDPVNFSDLFRDRFEEAVETLGTDEEAIGYSLLKDLQAINPGYPGIVNAIYNFEINLGIRERPPDQRKIAEADRLYREAQEILSKSRLSDIDFEVALDKLNEAYRNNPNDAKITSLKDRAQLLRGGTVTILDTQAQQQFRLAEQLFLDRKYFEALAVVERLLADPKNQRYAPLNDLKRRIDSFI